MDNITAPAIGIRLATDEIGGIHYPVGKMAHGGPDQATPVTADTPFPTADTAVAAALADILTKLIASPATADGQASTVAAINALATLLGGTLAVSAASLPLPGGAATGDKQDAGNNSLTAIANALAGALSVRQPGTAFTDRTVASLTAGQAGGTATVLNVNANRRVLTITPAADGKLYIASSNGNGFFWPLYAGVTRVLSGPDCPTSAIYVSGQAAGAALPMAEG